MIKQTLIICCSLLPVSYPACGEQQRVLHDPFAKPMLRKKLAHSGGNKVNSNAKLTPWSPKLTSTLRAGKSSMVIVGGQVIKLGEKIDGYKLIEVRERSGVFLKNRKQTRLTLDDNE